MQEDSVEYVVFMLSITGSGMIFSLLRLWKYKQLHYPQFLFCLMILSLSMFILSIALTSTGIYLRLPHFWRIFTALGYLNMPLCFLFFRVILTNRQRFERTDLWVVLPALIHLMNMVPFIFSGEQAKLEAVRTVMNDGNAFILEIEGFLLPGLNSWLRAFVAISMVIGQLLLLSGAAHHFTKGEGHLEVTDRRLYRWLWMLTAVISISMFLVLIQYTLRIIPDWNMLQIIPFATSLSLIFILGSLLLSPDLFKGFKHPLPKSDLFFCLA